MFYIMRKKLGLKIAATMTLIAVPVTAASIALVVMSEMASVEEAVLQKGRLAALVGAAAYAQVLETGIASGELKLADLIDPTYEEIVYPPEWNIRDRFHTKFDHYTDHHGIQELEDAFLVDPDIEFASGIDSKGYVPTTVTKYQLEPNGDPIHDQDARKKQRYNTVTHLIDARHTGPEPLVQPYTQKSTGRELWDIAAPIQVRGKHFGAFRVGVSRDQIGARGRELAIRLAWLVGIALTLLIASTFILVQWSMKPLIRLVGRATRLSLDSIGTELDEPIREPYIDEVGQMAKALERLRQSVRASVQAAWKS